MKLRTILTLVGLFCLLFQTNAVVHDDSESVIVEFSILFKGTGIGTPSLTVTAEGQEIYDSTLNPPWKAYTVTSGTINGNGSQWMTVPVSLKMYKGIPLDTPGTLKIVGQNIDEYKITLNGQDEKYVSFASSRERNYDLLHPDAAVPYISVKRRSIYWGSTSTLMGYTPDILPHKYCFYFKRTGDTQDEAGKISPVMPGWLNAKISLGTGKTGKDLGHLDFVQGRDLRFVSESWDTAIFNYTVNSVSHSQVVTASTVFDAYFDPNVTDPELNIAGAYVVKGFDRKSKPGTLTDHYDFSAYSFPTLSYTIGYNLDSGQNTSKTKIARSEGVTAMNGYAYRKWSTSPLLSVPICSQSFCWDIPGFGPSFCLPPLCTRLIYELPAATATTYVYDFASTIAADRNCRGSVVQTGYDANYAPTSRTIASTVGVGSLGLLTQSGVGTARFEQPVTPTAFGPTTDGQEYFWGSTATRLDGASLSQGGLLVGSANYYNGTLGGGDQKLQKQVFADGKWEYYEYFDEIESRGLLKRVTRPSFAGPTTPASAPVDSIVTDYAYTDNWDKSKSLPLSIITRQIVNNGASDKVISRTEYDYSDSHFENVTAPADFQGLTLQIEKKQEYTGLSATEYLETKTKTFRDDTDTLFSGLPLSIEYPDGTKTFWNYEMGTYDEPNRQFVPIGDSLAFRSVALIYNATINGHNPAFYGSQQYRIWKIHGTLGAVSGSISLTYGASSVTFTDPACNCQKTSTPGTESVNLVPGRSTAEAVTRDGFGRIRLVESFVLLQVSGVPTWVAVERESHDYAEGGNLIKTVKQRLGDAGTPWYTIYEAIYTDRNSEQTDYNSVSFDNSVGNLTGRKEFEKDRSGTIKRFKYDAYGHVSKVIVLAPPALVGMNTPAEIQTRYSFDSDGRVLTTGIGPRTSGDTDNAQALITSRSYNLAGLMSQEITPGGYLTSYSYSHPANSGISVTKTFPNNQTETAANYIDGQASSVLGTGVVPKYFSYAILGNGPVTVNGTPRILGSVQKTASQGNGLQHTSRSTIAESDWLGRAKKQTSANPATSPTGVAVGNVDTVYTYNQDKLWKTQVGALAPTFQEYDAFGQLVNQGVKLDSTVPAALNPASMDRINSQSSYFYLDAQGLWERSDNSVYPNDNSNVATALGSTRKFRYATVQNLDIPGNGTISFLTDSYTIAFDANNAQSQQYTLLARDKGLTLIQNVSPGSTQPDNQGFRNGSQAVYHFSPSLVREDYVYDAYGRLKQVTSRAGSTDTTFGPGTTQVLWSRTTDNIWTQFNYDPAARLTWKKQYTTKQVVQPQPGDAGRYTYFGYNNRNQLTQVWGDVPYPLWNIYYEAGGAPAGYAPELEGELYDQLTYNGAGAANSSFWPTAPGPANRTRYTYYSENGLVKDVMYDTTGVGSSFQKTSYEYNKYGALSKRTWNRGAVTQYVYDPSTGELTDIQYTDGTDPAPPNVGAIRYTRMGALKSLKDAADAVNGRSFSYRALDLQLDYELLPSLTYGAGLMLAGTYDALGRVSGWNFNRSGGSAHNSVIYDYDPASARLQKITTPMGGFQYSYVNNSDLISRIDPVGMAISLVQQRTPAPDSDLEANWTTSLNGALSASSLLYDGQDRLQKFNQTGKIYEYYGAGLAQNLGYNNRNELISAKSYLTWDLNAVPTPATALPRRGFGFNYDSMGNRAGTTKDTDPLLTYTPNLLGQYTSRDLPNFVEVSGFKGKSTTVTASRAGTTFSPAPATLTLSDPQFDYFYGQGVRPNSSAKAKEIVSVSASLAGAPTASDSRDVLVPAVTSSGASSETLTYDTDGNLTGDTFWIYRYDAENRLRQMESQPTLPALRVTFVYDFLGRRVKKTVETSPSGSWVTGSIRVFAYDGWHLIAEYDSTSGTAVLLKNYCWGLDKSGSVHGAGGVGGLLGLQVFGTGTKTLVAVNDAFGNVIGLVDGTTGALEASYEYSSFGEGVRASGPQATVNPFRFSTKYYDAETDLLCFGYRYYSTSQGRFITRDPLNEPGRSMLAAPLAGGDIVIWSYVGKMGSIPGKSRDLTPDTSLAKTGLSYSTDSQAGRFRNSTMPGNVVGTQKSNGGGRGGYARSLSTPYIGPSNDGGTHPYAYVNNGPHAAIDPLGLDSMLWDNNWDWDSDFWSRSGNINFSDAGSIPALPDFGREDRLNSVLSSSADYANYSQRQNVAISFANFATMGLADPVTIAATGKDMQGIPSSRAQAYGDIFFATLNIASMLIPEARGAQAAERLLLGEVEGVAGRAVAVDMVEQGRDALGRFLPKNGGEVIPGSWAEQAVWDAVKQKPGWNVIEGRVSVRNSGGDLRVYDGAAISPRGRVIGLEVKSGGAIQTSAQAAFDSAINTFNPAIGVGQSGNLPAPIGRSLLINLP